MMKHTTLVPNKFAIRVMLSACVGAGLSLAPLAVAVQAQVARPAPLEDLQTKDGSDFFNGRGNGQTGSVMNFIQNAIIGTPRSTDEFTADQKENFDEATSLFRKQQADRLRKQQNSQNPTPPVAPLPSGTAPSN